MSGAIACLIIFTLALSGTSWVVSCVRDWRENERWRKRARALGQPLCKRCRLPEEHWDHGSYGDHMFVEAEHG